MSESFFFIALCIMGAAGFCFAFLGGRKEVKRAGGALIAVSVLLLGIKVGPMAKPHTQAAGPEVPVAQVEAKS